MVDGPLEPLGQVRLFSTADMMLAPGRRISAEQQRPADLAGCPVMDQPSPRSLQAAAGIALRGVR